MSAEGDPNNDPAILPGGDAVALFGGSVCRIDANAMTKWCKALDAERRGEGIQVSTQGKIQATVGRSNDGQEQAMYTLLNDAGNIERSFRITKQRHGLSYAGYRDILSDDVGQGVWLRAVSCSECPNESRVAFFDKDDNLAWDVSAAYRPSRSPDGTWFMVSSSSIKQMGQDVGRPPERSGYHLFALGADLTRPLWATQLKSSTDYYPVRAGDGTLYLVSQDTIWSYSDKDGLPLGEGYELASDPPRWDPHTDQNILGGSDGSAYFWLYKAKSVVALRQDTTERWRQSFPHLSDINLIEGPDRFYVVADGSNDDSTYIHVISK